MTIQCPRLLALAISIITSLACSQATFAEVPPVRVMSFNLRYGNAEDGENSWKHRKDFVVQTIETFSPDLLGTQETLTYQRDYVSEHLPHLTPFGVGREDGKDKGELAALFYNSERFKKLDGGNFWLSQTPDEVGSKGWDAQLPRIATWVKLHDNADTSAKPILFLNTHFDHRGKEARIEAARLIRQKLSELGSGHRLVLTGDFNAGYQSEPYKALFGTNDSGVNKLELIDSYLASESPHPDLDQGTFTGFDPAKITGERIDWLAVSNDWRVRSARIDRSIFSGRLPSDHFPITAVITPANDQSPLRVLSYNIHHARGMDEQVDLKRIAQVIRDSDADFVALQEVDQNTERCGKIDQATEIGRLTDMYSYFGKAIDLQGGAYGQAVLSKYPFNDVSVVKLPNQDNREQRIVLVADIIREGKNYQFLGTHFDHQNEELRVAQAEAIVALKSKSASVSILAGDMNATPESQTIAKLLAAWGKPSEQSVKTFSSTKPERQIDYVLLSSPSGDAEKWTKGKLVVPKTEASDHLPLLFISN